MGYNKNHMVATEGHVFIDGEEILDCVKFELKATPEIAEGKTIGERTSSSRWTGIKYTGSITRYRSTPFLKNVLKKYRESGVIPELTIQGVMDDKASDYYQKYGNDAVTAVGCTLTGDIPLSSLDTAGKFVEDTISFNAYDVLL